MKASQWMGGSCLALLLAVGCTTESSSSLNTAQGGGGAAQGGGGAGAAEGIGGGSVCYPENCPEGPHFCAGNYFWCDAPPDNGEEFYTCRPIPSDCDDSYEPVCGCDGVVYGNRCEADRLGVEAGADSCAPDVTPPQRFPCGPHFCDPTVSFCHYTHGDTGDRFYECEPLPAGCDGSTSDPNCDCLADVSQYSYDCNVVEGNGVKGLEIDRYLQ